MEENNNNGTWITVAIVVVLLIIGGIYLIRHRTGATGDNNATSTENLTSSAVLPYGQTTVGLGESASFRGITITPTSVAEDSRCPKGVQCIQAGTVRLNVRATLDNGSTSNTTVTLGKAAAVSTFSVTLTAVSPDKQQNKTISGPDYRFTFEVRESAGGTEELQGKG
jgi:hypothetical protein